MILSQASHKSDELGKNIRTYYTAEREIKNIRYRTLALDHNYLYYDSFGNVETEIIYNDDYNSDGYQKEYNKIQYTYDTLQRPLTKEVYDNSGTLVYKETYSYDVTADYRKETVTVVGGENNPSVVTSIYYDNYGNKIKTEVGSDYETYTSDYAGNITSVKSARANNEGWTETRQISYDFMGNVVTETDEYGNAERA